MKRWIMRICVLLLLGAIINVAVAWGVWARDSRLDPGIGFFYCYSCYRCGWPMDSVKQTQIGFIPLFAEVRLQDVPIEPLFPGFAINTLFYAGVLCLLFFAPGALRRRQRIKRGPCVKCGYDLRGRDRSAGNGPSPVCPECGGT
jgi:hypothetical protein